MSPGAGPRLLAAAQTWSGAVHEHPLHAAASLAGLGAVTLVAALVLRWLNRRVRSLRGQVLTITLAALAIGATAAVGLTWLMVLDAEELGTVLGALALTAMCASVLVVLASAPLGRDVARLEERVRRIEGGDHGVVSTIDRSDELGHVARALNQLSEQLARLERERMAYEDERSAMLSSVSHDLRTPLAALQAALEALTDGIAPDPDRYLRSMQRDVDALAALIDDLFLLVRIENGRLELPHATVDLAEIADEAIEALAPVAAERGIDLRLRTAGGVYVPGNPTALGRVIRNLLDNSLRHAPVGSTVWVAVTSDGVPRVRVIDEGPGFPASFATHAFERFSRADSSRNRDTGGAGLGLAIARGVVEAHGGRIWIEQDRGGHVAFELPAA